MDKRVKKQIKKLDKYYLKILNNLNAVMLESQIGMADYLYTYLKYLRDTKLLTTEYEKLNNQLLSTLCGAVAEYELAISCIEHYYKLNDRGVLEPLDTDKPKEEIAKEYMAETDRHRNNFWALVFTNLESWENYEISI